MAGEVRQRKKEPPRVPSVSDTETDTEVDGVEEEPSAPKPEAAKGGHSKGESKLSKLVTKCCHISKFGVLRRCGGIDKI